MSNYTGMLMTHRMNDGPLEATAGHTYLGIGINNKLCWAEHIGNTVSNANKVFERLPRNLHIVLLLLE